MVGLIPLFAVETLEPELLDRLPDFNRRLKWLLSIGPSWRRWCRAGTNRAGRAPAAVAAARHRMKGCCSACSTRPNSSPTTACASLSRHHARQSVTYSRADGDDSQRGLSAGANRSRACSAATRTGAGPIWFPVNYLIIESLQKFHHYYGDDFKVECPTGSGRFMTINEVADELTRAADADLPARRRRPAAGASANDEKLQTDPHFRDYVSFYEYFHGDNGRGVGASHQTGWTGLVAKLLLPRREDDRHCDLRSNQKAGLAKPQSGKIGPQ